MTRSTEQETLAQYPGHAAQAELEILRTERAQLPEQYCAALAQPAPGFVATAPIVVDGLVSLTVGNG